MLNILPSAVQRRVLRRRLRDIAERQVAATTELKAAGATSYRAQELRSELSDLRSRKISTEIALEKLTGGRNKLSPEERRKVQECAAAHARFLDAEEAQRRKQCLEFIGKLEREGDHRQARIWRDSLLDLREQIEREFPV